MVQNTQSEKYYRHICHRCEYESELMSYEALYVHESLDILKQTLNIINVEFQITVLNKNYNNKYGVQPFAPFQSYQ